MPGCMSFRRFVPVLCVFLWLASAAFAQFTASIQGVVQDPSGAGVAKATVVVTNQATGAAATT